MEAAAIRLKRLREAANPKISIREMAAALELDHSTYVRYERPERFKKRHLPLELARRIAKILSDRGVNPDDVLALAGLGIDESGAPTLSAGEEQLVADFRQLDADQRRAVQVLIGSMVRAAGGRPSSQRGRRKSAVTEGERHGQQQEANT